MATRLEILFEKYLAKTCTAAEREELMGLALEPSLQEQLQSVITGAWEKTGEEEGMPEAATKVLMEKLFPAETEVESQVIDGKSRFSWWKVAAAIVIIVLGTSYFVWFNKPGKPKEIVQAPINNDVGPGSYKAKLTLADGSIIVLDSAKMGELAKQGKVAVINKDGQLVYSGKDGEVLYNTVSTAKGETYSMTLADGSKVWLNSGSSVHFPVAFTGSERRIEVTGEVYVKVAHNKVQPFIASVNGMEVLALGTEFNINAYSDEDAMKATLIEGSVKVSKGESMRVLQPGQQTKIESNGELTVSKVPNLNEVTGWKDGLFYFDNTDLKTILRQFARWYDVEIVYDGAVKERKFLGVIKRSNTLKTVLEILQDNDIVYRIEGKKLIVQAE